MAVNKEKHEFMISKDDLTKFLRNLADRSAEGIVEIETQNFTIKHEFDEPVKLEIEYNSNKESLEIELKFMKFDKLT